MAYRIKADNPKGLPYDLSFDDAQQAVRQIAHLEARGAKNITLNGKRMLAAGEE